MEIPTALVTGIFDCGPLQRILSGLSDRMTEMTTRFEKLTDENTTLAAAVKEATRRAQVSEEQYTALYNVVASLNTNFSSLHSNFISRSETEDGLQKLQRSVDALESQCMVLQTNKIDKDSPFLDGRVREVAHDTCVRYLNVKEKENRDWMGQQLTLTEAKASEMIIVSHRETRGQLELELDAMKRALHEASATSEKLLRDDDASVATLSAVVRGTLMAIDAHEQRLEHTEKACRDEADELHYRVRLVLKALGTSWHALTSVSSTTTAPSGGSSSSAKTNAGTTATTDITVTANAATASLTTVPVDSYEDPDDIERLYRREVAAAKGVNDMKRHWQLIRALHPSIAEGLGGASASTTNLGGALDDLDAAASAPSANPAIMADFRKSDRLKRLDQRERARLEKQRETQATTTTFTSAGGAVTTVQPSALPAVSLLLLHGPLLVAQRVNVLAQCHDSLGQMRAELIADVSQQVQTVIRELRAKISSQRAVELIEEFATKTVIEQTKPLEARMDRVEGRAVLRDDFVASLANKADRMGLLDKASVDDVNRTEALFKERLQAVHQELVRGNQLTLERVMTLETRKMDKDDPNLTSLMTSMSTQGVILGQSMGSGAAAPFITAQAYPPSTPRHGGLPLVPPVAATPQNTGAAQRCLSCLRPVADSGDQTVAAGQAAAGNSMPRAPASRPASAATTAASAATTVSATTLPPSGLVVDPRKPLVGDWVQRLDARFREKVTIAPHPPI